MAVVKIATSAMATITRWVSAAVRVTVLTATLHTAMMIATLVRMPHVPLAFGLGTDVCAQRSTQKVVTWIRPKAFAWITPSVPPVPVVSHG